MYKRKSPISVIALSMAMVIPLSGCGGGGGTATAPTTPPDPLQPAAGLTPSTATAVYAADAADTLDELFPDGSRAFAPLTAGLDRQFDEPQSSELSGFFVKEIRSDGANGFRITYAGGDGETRTVHIAEADFRPDVGEYYKEEPDGRDYWFWSFTGMSEFTYLGAYGTSFWTPREGGGVSERSKFVFGVRTRPANMPSVSAAYEGRMRADSWMTSDPAGNQRQRIVGGIRLAANFDLGTLEGRIINIRGQAPGVRDYEAWSTSRFEITNGRIVNGQFTATLAGVETDPDAPDDASLRGFSGAILGEFYGPGAEEVGGVLNATRDLEGEDNDRTLTGFIGGKEPATGLDEMPISAGVDRGGYSSASPSIALQDDGNRVTRIAGDGAGGFLVTYAVDGVEQPEVHLETADVGADSRLPITYFKRNDTTAYYLYSETGSIGGVPEFDHFDVKGWFEFAYPTVASAEGGDFGQADSGIYAFVVHGDRTAEMPAAGQASYEGRGRAYVWNPAPGEGRANRGSAERYDGDFGLTADFAASTISGAIENLWRRLPDQDWSQVTGSLSIRNGQIDGNALSADLTGFGFTGTANGAFYGPDAAEVGGILTGTHSDGRLLQGWYGGDKE